MLEKASEIYKGKGFQYFRVYYAGRAFSIFPDLDGLDAIATKKLNGQTKARIVPDMSA